MKNKSLHLDKFKQKGQVKKIPKISWKYLESLNINGLFDWGNEERIDTSTMNSYRKGIWKGLDKSK